LRLSSNNFKDFDLTNNEDVLDALFTIFLIKIKKDFRKQILDNYKFDFS